MKHFSRFLITLIATLLLFSSLTATPVHAQQQQNWVFNDFPSCVEGAILQNLVCKSAYFLGGFNDNILSALLHMDGAVPKLTVTPDAYQRNPKYVQDLNQGSAIAGVNSYIAMIYTHPPASTSLALQDFGQSLGILPKQAFAQGPGIGFSGLKALLGIWRVFRNIAYMLIAIVMVVIGFMVMFRKKIDPKTVVTVQNALPRIVVTILLITFSYAIVGVLIDLMYLLMLFIMTLIVQAYPSIFLSDTIPGYMSGGLWRAFWNLMWGGWASIDDLVKMIFYGPQFGPQWFLTAIANAIPGYFGAQYALVWLIVSIALLFGFVRIFFMLLTSYIQVIIAVLVGPLQILVDAFPGGTSFSSWIKNLISNLSVFPVTAAMFLIGTVLARAEVENLWTPPLLGGENATSRGITGLIGLGVLLTIPSVANSIKEALKAKPPVAAGPGAIIGPLGAGAGQVAQLAYQGSFIYSAFKHKPDTRAREDQLSDAARGEVVHKAR